MFNMSLYMHASFIYIFILRCLSYDSYEEKLMEVMVPLSDEIAVSMPFEHSPEFVVPIRDHRRSHSHQIINNNTPSKKKTAFYHAKSRVIEVETVKNAAPYQNMAIPVYRRNRSVKARSFLSPELEMDEGDSSSSSTSSTDSDGDDDAEKARVKPRKPRNRKVCKKLRAFDVVIEWILFIFTVVVLFASFYADSLKNRIVWGSAIWKWCMLVAVIFCGRLVTKWAKDCIVLLVENKFLFSERVVYFLHGVKGSVRFCIWLAMVLIAWCLLINKNVRLSKETFKVLRHITKALISLLVGAIMWMVKNLLVKFIAATFHVKTFFVRIREAISDEYVLWTLSIPRSMELDGDGGRVGGRNRFSWSRRPKWMGGRRKQKKDGTEKSITLKRLGRIKPEKMPATALGQLIEMIQGSKLSIYACDLYGNNDDSSSQQKHIITRYDAEVASSLVFRNVTRKDQPCYMVREDLFDFESHENRECLDEWFEKVSEEGRITEVILSEWVVNIYKQREYLSHSLKDARKAIKELDRIFSGIILILIIVVGLLIMGFATTKVVFFLASQILLVAFMFGNTCRTLFEAVIFVFVMHPFDVGDRCVVDGVQMIVEEMDMLKTAFLRYDNEMIYYPNAILATKVISNFNRSPERMGDPIFFDIDVSTPAASIEALKEKIKKYIQEKSHHWHPDQSLQVIEIENMNKMKMVLGVNHKINFQDYAEKTNRRTELLLALRDMIAEIGIKYRLPPQELHTIHHGQQFS